MEDKSLRENMYISDVNITALKKMPVCGFFVRNYSKTNPILPADAQQWAINAGGAVRAEAVQFHVN